MPCCALCVGLTSLIVVYSISRYASLYFVACVDILHTHIVYQLLFKNHNNNVQSSIFRLFGKFDINSSSLLL